VAAGSLSLRSPHSWYSAAGMLGRVCGMDRQRGLACAVVTGSAVTRFRAAASLLIVPRLGNPRSGPSAKRRRVCSSGWDAGHVILLNPMKASHGEGQMYQVWRRGGDGQSLASTIKQSPSVNRRLGRWPTRRHVPPRRARRVPERTSHRGQSRSLTDNVSATRRSDNLQVTALQRHRLATLTVQPLSPILAAWDIRGMQRNRRSRPQASPQVTHQRPT